MLNFIKSLSESIMCRFHTTTVKVQGFRHEPVEVCDIQKVDVNSINNEDSL
jgi:hypothetical protein